MKIAICAWPLAAKVLTQHLENRGWEVRTSHPGEKVGNLDEFFDNVNCFLFFAGSTTMPLLQYCQQKKIAIVRWWVGTDVLSMYNASPLYKVVINSKPLVTAELFETPALRAEMAPLGFAGDVLPVVTPIFCYDNPPPPMPEKKTILAYLPKHERASYAYGGDEIRKLAKLLKGEYRFIVVGGGEVEDAENMGWVDFDMQRKLYEQSNLLYRPVPHDGKSGMVIEAMSYGRHIIRGIPFPMSLYAPSAEDAKRMIDHLDKELNILDKVNIDIATMVRSQYEPNRLINILQAVCCNAVDKALDRLRHSSMLYQGKKNIFCANTLWVHNPVAGRG